VTRRLPAPPAVAAAALAVLLLVARPTPSSASGLTTYRLTNTGAAGTAPVKEIVASVIPPGTIKPSDPSVSPLTILDGSSGFDQADLKVLLGEGQTPDGDPLQALALQFGDEGFAPGGVLNFSLSLDPAFEGDLQLVLPPSTSGLTIDAIQAPPVDPGNDPNGGDPNNPPPVDPGTNVPEPLSLLLWSSLAGLGLIRARAFRRSHAPVA
jgi:hypothetical protein